MTLESRLDSALARLAVRKRRRVATTPFTHWVPTPAGNVRLHDSGGDGPCVVIVPDGPNLIEHCAALIALLRERYRVVCFDMPGFGHSLPASKYTHSLDEGAAVVLAVLDALRIERAALAFSCANGFYALRASRLAPGRINALVLSQTPSLPAMQAWAHRVVPRPLHVPVIGQVAGWLVRRKAVRSWYRMALPAGSDTGSMREPAVSALDCGACFSLASVVQGLVREPESSPLASLVPCVLAWGTMDRSHRHTNPHSLKDVMPHLEVVVFANCGHFPDLEDPVRFAQVVDDAVSAALCSAV